jgi:hypothetical protein
MAVNAIDVKTLGIYLSSLAAVSFLPASAENGECELPRIIGGRSKHGKENALC